MPEPSNSWLNKCQSLDDLWTNLDSGQLDCVIGKHGGRHYHMKNDNGDTSYVTYNDIVNKFIQLSSKDKSQIQLGLVNRIAGRIKALNINGNEKLKNASSWARFGSFWRQIGQSHHKQHATMEGIVTTFRGNIQKMADQYMRDYAIEENERQATLEGNHQKVNEMQADTYALFLDQCLLLGKETNRYHPDATMKQLLKVPIPKPGTIPGKELNQLQTECQQRKAIHLADLLLQVDEWDFRSQFGMGCSIGDGSLSLDFSQWPLNLLNQLPPGELRKAIVERFRKEIVQQKGPGSFISKVTLTGELTPVPGATGKRVPHLSAGREPPLRDTLIRDLLEPALLPGHTDRILDRWAIKSSDEPVVLEFLNPKEIESVLRWVSQTQTGDETTSMDLQAGLNAAWNDYCISQFASTSPVEFANSVDFQLWLLERFQEADPSWRKDWETVRWTGDLLVALQKSADTDHLKSVIAIHGGILKTVTNELRSQMKLQLSDIRTTNGLPKCIQARSIEIPGKLAGHKAARKVVAADPTAERVLASTITLAELTSWVTYLDELEAADETGRVDRAAMQFLERLPRTPADMQAFLESIPQADIPTWTARLDQINTHLLQANFSLGRSCMPHTHLAAILRSAEVMQQLLMRDESARFDNLCFGVEHLVQGLKDPYLDLGTSGPEIMAICRRLEALNTEPRKAGHFERAQIPWQAADPYDYSLSGGEESQTKAHAHEHGYLRQFIPGAAASKAPVKKDPTAHLPQSFKDTRNTFRLLNVAIAPSHSIDTDRTRMRYGDWHQTLARIQSGSKGPLRFEQVDDETLIMQPYGLPVCSAMDAADGYLCHPNMTEEGQITSYAHQQGAVHDAAIRRRIIEGIVTVGQLGSTSYGSRTVVGRYIARDEHGQKAVPLYQGQAFQPSQILEDATPDIFDNLTPSQAMKLQLMQTAPMDRVHNTILRFAEKPSLLENPDWQRVMELNFFRFAYLYQKMQTDPEFTDLLVTHLQILAKRLPPDSPVAGFMAKTLSTITEITDQALRDSAGPPPERLTKALGEVRTLRDSYVNEIHKGLVQWERRSEAQSAEKVKESHVQSWLHCMSMRPLEQLSIDERLEFVKWFQLYAQTPPTDRQMDTAAAIQTAADRILPSVATHIKENPTLLRSLISLRLKVNADMVWTHDATGLVWSSSEWEVNLTAATARRSGVKAIVVPAKVRGALRDLVSPEVLRAKHDGVVKFIGGVGYSSISFSNTYKGKQREFEILIPASASAEPIIRMKINEKWFQTQPLNANVTPRVLQSLTCWTDSTGEALLCDSAGKVMAKAHLSEGGLQQVQLLHIPLAQGKYLLSPQKANDTAAFQRLELANGILLLADEPDGELTLIAYPDLGLSYRWNAQIKKWESSTQPGTYLSNRDLRELSSLKPLAKTRTALRDPTSPTAPGGRKPLAPRPVSAVSELFSSSFFDYHMLEDSTGSPTQVLLSGREYTRRPPPVPGQKLESAASHKRFAKEPLNTTAPMLFTYDITDPERGLCARQPEGYLYLSYSLYVQGRYSQAAIAMRQAFLRMQGLSPQAAEIIQFFDRWPTDDPNATALRAQLSLYEVEQRQMEQVDAPSALQQEEMLAKALEAFSSYAELEQSEQVDRQLLLSEPMKAKFQFLARRCPSWALKRLENAGLTSEKRSEIQKAVGDNGNLDRIEGAVPDLQKICDNAMIDIRDLAFYATRGWLTSTASALTLSEEQREDLLCYSLDREIEARTAALPPVEPPTPTKPPKTTVEVSTAESPRVIESASVQRLRATQAEASDPFVKHMLGVIASDTTYYEQSVLAPSPAAAPVVDLELVKKMFSIATDLTNQKQQQQNQIIGMFRLGDRAYSPLRKLQEQDAEVIDLFRTGRDCLAEGNWEPLIQRGVILPGEVEALKTLYINYLVTSTELQQVKQTKALLQRPYTDENQQALANQLQKKRLYDVEKHPDGMALLLLEEELGILCTEGQIQHFSDAIHHRGSFKHEVWGGGKTTVLRHLITKYRADGAHLSSLLTHAPLMEEHHKQLKESTAAVYGQQAYRTEFARNETPTDRVAIRREHLKLLKTIQEKGRTDQTMSSLISSRHAHTLMVMRVKDERDTDAPEAFGKLLRLRQDRMVLGSDELDQAFNPQKNEHSYATGKPRLLDQDVYQPGLRMMELLHTAEYEEFLPFFTTKLTTDMPVEQRARLLKKFAEDLTADVTGIERDKLIQYLLPDPNPISQAQHEENLDTHQQVAKHPRAKELQNINILLKTVLPVSFSAKAGVSFGRARDGIHTKPYSDGGKCSESAQHSDSHLMAWYSCMDMMRNGIMADEGGAEPIPRRTKAIQTYLALFTGKAELEMANGLGDTLDQTPTGREFQAKFGALLSSPPTIDAMADMINGKIELRIDFLKRANLESTRIYTRRLVGNGHQVAHDVLEIWGSSGTPGDFPLPRKIRVDEALARQKGTIGRIYHNMAQGFTDATSPSKVTEVATTPNSFAVVVAEQAKKGTALIDAGPLFGGLRSEECVTQIVRQMGKDVIPIRYVNSKGAVVVRENGKDRPEEDSGRTPEECFTLFSHADRRGRDLRLPPNSHNLITLSADTTLTDFSQAGMRARGWGKGQILSYLIDPGLAARLGDVPHTPEKIMRVLVENESERLKRLHTMDTRQAILSIGDAAVQRMLREAGGKSLIALRDLCDKAEYLEQSTEANLEKLSAPKKPVASAKYFSDLRATEKLRLEALLKAIQESTAIDSAGQASAKESIERALEELDASNLVPKPEFLPTHISATDLFDSEGTTEQEAEVETEVMAEVATEIQTEMEVAVEMQSELALELEAESQEMEVEAELQEEANLPKQDWIETSREYTPVNLPAPSELDRGGTADALQRWKQGGLLCTADIAPAPKPAHWYEPPPNIPRVFDFGQMSPAVLLVCNKETGRVEGVVGTAKDEDLAFATYADKCKDQTNYTIIHYKFADQRAFDQAFSTLSPEARREAIAKVAWAKASYAAGVYLRPEEREVLRAAYNRMSGQERAEVAARLHSQLDPLPVDERGLLEEFSNGFQPRVR